MRTGLSLICSFTVLATTYLTLSLIILHPPRANYQTWFLMAALFLGQSVLTLIAVGGGVTGTRIRGRLIVGSAAIIWVGGSWAYATATGPHFEGYALVLGSVVVVQGALSLAVLVRSAHVARS